MYTEKKNHKIASISRHKKSISNTFFAVGKKVFVFFSLNFFSLSFNLYDVYGHQKNKIKKKISNRSNNGFVK